MAVGQQTATGAPGSPGLHRYRAYGLAIASELAFPELDADDRGGPADVTVRLAPTGRGAPQGFASNFAEFGEDEQFMCWPLVGGFLMKGVDEILAERSPGVSDQLLPFPLLGPVMAMLLHLRGLLVLHASAVAIGKGSAVFLGDKGDGKSTTAASFVRAGYRLITDDLLSIDTGSAGRVDIIPGYPQIKLAADAEEAVLMSGASARPLVLPDFEKRQQLIAGAFDHQPIPPGAIYVLSRGQEAKASRLSPIDALSTVMRFSYISRFPTRRMPPDEAREHLRQCAALVAAAPVYRLETPQGLDRLDEVVRLVESQLA